MLSSAISTLLPTIRQTVHRAGTRFPIERTRQIKSRVLDAAAAAFQSRGRLAPGSGGRDIVDRHDVLMLASSHGRASPRRDRALQ